MRSRSPTPRADPLCDRPSGCVLPCATIAPNCRRPRSGSSALLRDARRMTTKEIGQKLVDLCKAGKNMDAVQQLYAQDIVSVEAGAPPGQSPESKGIGACVEKGKQWEA